MELIVKYQYQIKDESLWYNEDSSVSFFSKEKGHLGTISNLREGYYTFGLSLFGNCTVQMNLNPNLDSFKTFLAAFPLHLENAQNFQHKK